MSDMDIAAWQTQLRKGAAELVVLSLLESNDHYGLSILEHAGGAEGIISDGNLYPLLTRLEKDGKIIGRWIMNDTFRNPRKYYRLTDEGMIALVQMRETWRDFSALVSSFMERENNVQSISRGRNLSGTAG